MAVRKQSKSKSRSHSRSRSITRRLKHKRGGAVLLPKAYFGGDADNYFPAGDAKLTPGSSAYGQFNAVSQGVAGPNGMYGPNVGPYPGASCTQTGGRKRSKKNSKKSGKKHGSKKSKKTLRRRK
jgi:hypothetical protein